MLYFLIFLSIEKFHERRRHIGVKKAVSKTKSKLKPSIPRVTLRLEKGIHPSSWQSWNWLHVGSKKQNKIMVILNTTKDQNNENVLMKRYSEIGTKERNRAPVIGSKRSDSNILGQMMELNHRFLITKQVL